MEKIKITYHKTKVGELIIGSYDNKLCLLDWRYRKMRDSIDNRIKSALNTDYIEINKDHDDITKLTKKQLEEYFKGERKVFDIPLLMVGTEFQKRVWNALLQVEYGNTSSYLELSRKIGNEKAIRAVASANGANAISIIVPCHRIIGSDGKLVGYAGGLTAKRTLLDIENENTIYRGSLI